MANTEMIRLDERVGIITGAANGLGRGYARLLAERGARLVLNDVDADVEKIAAEINERGGQAVVWVGSVAERSSGDQMVGLALESFSRLDFIVANAGGIRRSEFEDQTDEDLAEMLDVHVRGTFLLARAAYRVMKQRGYGRIVLTGSNAGLFGQPRAATYAAAKGAIVGLGGTLALEGAPHGVRTNVLHPLAATAMSPHVTGDKALQMRPEQVAGVVAYLVSDACEVDHELVLVGGGALARNFAATTPGWHVSNDEMMTPEAARDALRAVAPNDVAVVPATVAEDVAHLLPDLA